MAEVHHDVEVGVGALLLRELDVAADGEAARVLRAAVGGLHDAGAAAGHDGEAGVGQAGADIAGELVVAMVLLEARGAEDGDARADEVELAEAAHHLEEDLDGEPELEAARLRAGEELAFLLRARAAAG